MLRRRCFCAKKKILLRFLYFVETVGVALSLLPAGTGFEEGTLLVCLEVLNLLVGQLAMLTERTGFGHNLLARHTLLVVDLGPGNSVVVSAWGSVDELCRTWVGNVEYSTACGNVRLVEYTLLKNRALEHPES